MNVRKATPLFVVDAISSATIAFWEKTGWTKLVEVPHDGATGFVIFAREGREVMLQTRASVRADLALETEPTCAFYMDVPNVAAARADSEAAGARVVIRERETFYGARECWVVDPSGVLLGFAQTHAAST